MAAATIGYTALNRLQHLQPIEQVGLGLVISLIASLVNLAVAQILLRAGRRYNSIVLEADAKHLMTDVWTSAGVLAGVGAVAVTGWLALDPLIAIAVAVNILWSGGQLVRRSVQGLMDSALPPEERAAILMVLERYAATGIAYHSLRTRQAGTRRFVSVHVLVPGSWTVRQGHDLLEKLEAELRQTVLDVTLFTHLEPIEDPVSLADSDLDRQSAGPREPEAPARLE